MNIFQLVLLAFGVLALLAIGYALFSGPNTAKASQRRLQESASAAPVSADTEPASEAIAARPAEATTFGKWPFRKQASTARTGRCGPA